MDDLEIPMGDNAGKAGLSVIILLFMAGKFQV
jgi:hypothetical protein